MEDEADLIGQVAMVLVRIEGGNHPGEVSVLLNGIRERYFAFSPQEVPVGASVLVVNLRGLRTLDVEAWVPTPT